MPDKDAVLEALSKIRDPDLGKDIVSLGFVKEVRVADGTVAVTIELTTPACPVKDTMREQARQAVLALPGVKRADVTMTAQVRPSRIENKARLAPRVKNIVPIASGKGGVGKSTISANLAVALAKLGARVGLMDADVYGPSIPMIMGATAGPGQSGDRFVPVERHGVKILSMGFFIPPGEAVVWRGPMLHKTIEQFLGQTDWGELDYLLVDLPPGTGDVQLSLCQLMPLTGAAVVSTPQDVALTVAEKAIIMFGKLRTPVLGIVENMSGFVCSHCGAREEVFGSGGARRYAEERRIPFLGEIPLATEIRTTSDAGTPIVVSAPDSPGGRAFFGVARALAAQVSIAAHAGPRDGTPEPAEVSRPAPGRLSIRWSDGHASDYSARDLRFACRCAVCVEEMSGKALLRPETIPAFLDLRGVQPTGRYALHIAFSDGHESGIYTFDRLRELCPCPECRAKR